jgi:two-component system, chemotaxis family, chemotaxis protein CheY
MSKILIIDDSAFQRKVISTFLTEGGHVALQAAGGTEGMDLLMKENPDLILLDMLMPDITGTDLLKKIRDSRISIPVVVVSADIQEATRSQCFALGAADFINKPVDKGQLLESVSRVLKKRAEEK